MVNGYQNYFNRKFFMIWLHGYMYIHIYTQAQHHTTHPHAYIYIYIHIYVCVYVPYLQRVCICICVHVPYPTYSAIVLLQPASAHSCSGLLLQLLIPHTNAA